MPEVYVNGDKNILAELGKYCPVLKISISSSLQWSIKIRACLGITTLA